MRCTAAPGSVPKSTELIEPMIVRALKTGFKGKRAFRDEMRSLGLNFDYIFYEQRLLAANSETRKSSY
jgi:hypothetical protein